MRLREARDVALHHGGGVGLVLSPALNLTVFDLDLPADVSLEAPQVIAWQETAGGLAHLSPGGHGLHALVRGQPPQGHRRHVQLAGLQTEVFSHTGFVTLTGVYTHPAQDLQEPIPDGRSLLSRLFPAPTPQPRPATLPSTRDPSEQDGLVVMRARHPDLGRLLDGQLDAHTVPPEARHPDQRPDMSVVEYRLVSHLRFWLSADRERILQTFLSCGFAQLPCRQEKWGRRPQYVENLVDKVLQDQTHQSTYRGRRREDPSYPGNLQAPMRARVADLDMHGHTRTALQKLVDELIGQAVQGKFCRQPDGNLRLYVSLSGLAARLGGHPTDIHRRLQALHAAGVIAGLVHDRSAVRVLLYTDQAQFLATTCGPAPTVTIRQRQRSPYRLQVQGTPQRPSTRGVASLRDVVWVARAVLRDGDRHVKKIAARTGQSAPSVRHQLRRLVEAGYVTRTSRCTYGPACTWKLFLDRMVAQHRQLRAPYLAAWADKLSRRQQRVVRYMRAS